MRAMQLDACSAKSKSIIGQKFTLCLSIISNFHTLGKNIWYVEFRWRQSRVLRWKLRRTGIWHEQRGTIQPTVSVNEIEISTYVIEYLSFFPLKFQTIHVVRLQPARKLPTSSVLPPTTVGLCWNHLNSWQWRSRCAKLECSVRWHSGGLRERAPTSWRYSK